MSADRTDNNFQTRVIALSQALAARYENVDHVEVIPLPSCDGDSHGEYLYQVFLRDGGVATYVDHSSDGFVLPETAEEASAFVAGLPWAAPGG